MSWTHSEDNKGSASREQKTCIDSSREPSGRRCELYMLILIRCSGVDTLPLSKASLTRKSRARVNRENLRDSLSRRYAAFEKWYRGRMLIPRGDAGFHRDIDVLYICSSISRNQFYKRKHLLGEVYCFLQSFNIVFRSIATRNVFRFKKHLHFILSVYITLSILYSKYT